MAHDMIAAKDNLTAVSTKLLREVSKVAKQIGKDYIPPQALFHNDRDRWGITLGTVQIFDMQ